MNLRDHDTPCEHGHWFSHVWMGDECPGGAVVVIDYEAVAAVEHEQWTQWSQDVADSIPDYDPRLDRWEKYWVPYHMLDEDVKEQDRKWASRAVDAALGLTDE